VAVEGASRGSATARRFSAAAGISVILVIVLFLAARALHDEDRWPGSGSDNLLLTGIFVLGALPLLVVLLDVVIKARGSVKTRLFELDLSAGGSTQVMLSVEVPPNLGVGTNSITDTASSSILAELHRAAVEPVSLIDLGGGDAWWESRLFIFAAGAARRGRPEVLVFTAERPDRGTVVGWATPSAVTGALMRPGRPRSEAYHTSHSRAAEAADAWARSIATTPPPHPVPPEVAALPHPWNAAWIGAPGGQLNPYAAEQFLAADLGNTLELPWLLPPGTDNAAPPVTVTPESLAHLLGEELATSSLAHDARSDAILESYLTTTSPWLVVTKGNQFERAIPRAALQDAVVQALVRSVTAAEPD
jgi:hypothetical protein